MFHNDTQTQHTNNWKRVTNEHPINRILTSYFNTDKKTKNSNSNVQSNNQKSETNHIMQRQRVIRSFLNRSDESESFIRKPVKYTAKSKLLPTTSTSSPHSLFAELNEQSINTNTRTPTIKRGLERQSPILLRRHGTSIENLTIQQRSDIANSYDNSTPSPVPPVFPLRNNLSHSFLLDRSSLKQYNPTPTLNIKPLSHSKTISENILKINATNPIGFHPNTFLPARRWSPIAPETGNIQNQPSNNFSRSKSYLSKYSIKRHLHLLKAGRINTTNRIAGFQDLFISPRSIPNSRYESEINKKRNYRRPIVEDWDDSKWTSSNVSDEDDSISGDGNNSTSTCISQVSVPSYDSSLSSNVPSEGSDIAYPANFSAENFNTTSSRGTGKRSLTRRRTYNIGLPPVTENIGDEETEQNVPNCTDNIHTDLKNVLENLYALRDNISNENINERSLDDEQSLTFQLLNQPETEFEKQISILNKSSI